MVSGPHTGTLAAAPASAGGRTAVVCEKRRRTHGDFKGRIASVAAGLAGIGCEPGDCVAILSSNRLEYLEAEAGIRAAAAQPVRLDWRLPAAGVADQLRRVRARAAFAESRLLPMLDSLRRLGETPRLRTIVAFGPGPGPGDLGYNELCAAALAPEPEGLIPVVASDSRLGLDPDCSTYVVDELCRAGPEELAWPVLGRGGAVHLRKSGTLSTSAVLDYTSQHRITHLVLTPSTSLAVLESGEHERHDLSGLRTVVCPGAPEVAERLRRALPRLAVIG